MHTERSQVKVAEGGNVNTLLGRLAQSWMWKYLKDKPLKSVYDTDMAARAISDPARMQFDQAIRALQSKATGGIGDLGVYGLLGGGALAAAYGIPKLLKTREALKNQPETDELEMIGASDKAAQVKNAAGIFEVLGNTFKGLAGDVGTGALDVAYGGVPKEPSEVQGPYGAPPGSLWPLYVGVPALAAMGGMSMTSKLVNRLRAKMIARRKKELQSQFQSLLAGTPKTASATLVNNLATDWQNKQAEIPAKLTGLAALALASLMTVGGVGGYQLAKAYNPATRKKKLLEDALEKRQKSRAMMFRAEPMLAGEDIGPEPTSHLDRSMYNLPIVMPANKRSMFGTDVQKYASIMVGGQPVRPSFFKVGFTPTATPGETVKLPAVPAATGEPVAPTKPSTSVKPGGFKGWAGDQLSTLIEQEYPQIKKLKDSGALDALGGMDAKTLKIITDNAGNLPDLIAKSKSIPTLGPGVSDRLSKLTSEQLDALSSLTPEMIGKVQAGMKQMDDLKGGWDKFKTGLGEGWEGIKGLFKNVGSTLMSGIDGLGSRDALPGQPPAGENVTGGGRDIVPSNQAEVAAPPMVQPPKPPVESAAKQPTTPTVASTEMDQERMNRLLASGTTKPVNIPMPGSTRGLTPGAGQKAVV